ncbi:MAG: type II secretion system protein GspN [Nitrospirae bacterium]|nr:type II secretion system protein GspN [Nitrospirota bacterium]MBF0591068.1 type II secretion system protein GspN [Nitrospirota bacterium]
MTTATKSFIAIVVLLVTITAVSLGAWLIAIPEDLIVSWIKNSVEKPLVIEINDLRKETLFNVKIKDIRLLLSKNNELIILNDCTIKINPVFLLSNTVKVYFKAGLSGGYIKGSGIIRKDLVSISGNMDNIELSGLNYLKRYSLKGHGIFSGTFTYDKDTGELAFKIRDFTFSDLYSHGIYLPLKYFNEINGLLFLKKEQLTAESVTFSGKGIYARIKGRLVKGSGDIKIDIMPEDNFPDKDRLALIKNYEVSPGVYSIEIKKWLY